MSADPEALRRLPSVDQLLRALGDRPEVAGIPRPRLTAMVREVVDAERRGAREADHPLADLETLAARVVGQVQQTGLFSLRPVINATGVVLHTNLGRALLSPLALERVLAVGAAYSNLELDVATKERGSRYSHVEALLRRLTGAEDALVVNNNAAAVLLALETLAHGKEVIVSRGELIEIGGEFRIPDIMRRGGAVLREVGATNRTHLRDYAEAIGPNTALLLKVHTSNYRVIGFTADVQLARAHRAGPGARHPRHGGPGLGLADRSAAVGLSVRADRPRGRGLRGGPRDVLRRQAARRAAGGHRGRQAARSSRGSRRTPGTAPCGSTSSRSPRWRRRSPPTRRGRRGRRCRRWRVSPSRWRASPRAPGACARGLGPAVVERLAARIVEGRSQVGGGALPTVELPTAGLALGATDAAARALDAAVRAGDPPVIGRLVDDRLFLDCRTVLPGQVTELVRALTRAARA